MKHIFIKRIQSFISVVVFSACLSEHLLKRLAEMEADHQMLLAQDHLRNGVSSLINVVLPVWPSFTHSRWSYTQHYFNTQANKVSSRQDIIYGKKASKFITFIKMIYFTRIKTRNLLIKLKSAFVSH